MPDRPASLPTTHPRPDDPHPAPAATRPPALSAAGLHKRFGDQVVLAGVSLEIAPGERVALLGESGSGKSTLLNIVAGLEPADAGTIHVAGERVDGRDADASARVRRERLGFVFQAFHLLPQLDALANVMVPLLLLGTPYREARRRAQAQLEALGMSGRTHALPATLSGGEQQRVAIARALVGTRRLVMADEPTGALDSHTGEEVLRVLRQRCDEGASGLLVTHESRYAGWADRVVFLRDGVVVDATGSDPVERLLEPAR